MGTGKSNGVKPQLYDVRTKIEGMKLMSDCAVDLTEERRIKRAEILGYNKAIDDVCKVLREYVI